MAQSSATDKYTLNRVLAYIQSVEESYGVSINFYFTITRAPDGNAVQMFSLMASGEIIDELPDASWPPSLASTDDDPETTGWCLYHMTRFLEARMFAIREPIGARPTL